MKHTKVFHKGLDAYISENKYIVHQGGTSSSKTWSTLQLLFHIAVKKSKEPFLISVVSESLPHLKRGCLRDFKLILEGVGINVDEILNKTDNVFTFGKCQIEFFGADDSKKLRGARRDVLFINECNNISFEAFTQLDIRTRVKTIIDFNPVSEFWAHKHIIPRDNVVFIKSTYLDNDQLEPSIVKSITQRAENDPEWAKVYRDGEVGSLEGLIFKNWSMADTIPQEAKLLAYGLDFGFTNDPTACTAVYRYDGALWLDEILYEHGLTNDVIAKRLNIGRSEVIADSAEPKSIAELNKFGMNVKPAQKGKDSINQGIDIMKRQPIIITKSSINLITEFRNYKWATTKDGETLNKPIDNYNDGVDSARYVCLNKIGKSSGVIYGFSS
jgi:phage terminase large subunit